MKKILVITPKFPLPASGACEKDRIKNITDLKRLGFDARVIAKVFAFQDDSKIQEWARNAGVQVYLDRYQFEDKKNFWQKVAKIFNPLNWDGAASEYARTETRILVEKVVSEWQPDLVWFDYTYLWPLHNIFGKRKIPIITRSINYEPIHFLQEDGFGLLNFIKFFPKVLSEFIVALKSDILFAITPKEAKLYRILGGGNRVLVLPLRDLANCLKAEWFARDSKPLNVFFMGASYNVHHNRSAVEFLVKDVAPEVEKQSPGDFVFHILGKKLPKEFEKYLNKNVVYEGYVPNLDEFISKMDIAVAPSLYGAGMQQKIFEPLARGIPSVISKRGIADYPFFDGKHVLFAESKEEFVDKLIKLKDLSLREILSKGAKEQSQKLFSEEVVDRIVIEAIKSVVKKC